MQTRFLSVLLLVSVVVAGSLRGEETPSAVKPPEGAQTNANAAASSAANPAMKQKDYELKQVGTLHLIMPQNMEGTFKSALELGTRVDEMAFFPTASDDFVIIVNAIHQDAKQVRGMDTKAALEEAIQKELATAEETKADIHAVTGFEVVGSYVSLTDKSVSVTRPKPGEFKYLTQGFAKLGNLILAFRSVSNKANGEEKEIMLSMIKTARLTPAK
ncbi:MAG: hypothetical protein JWR19_4605 [Pedosphaera sp.]|nr:hypothetical protein [Pedosphaera sp.]